MPRISPEKGTLYFEKISRFDRQQEPVTVSIPFAAGCVTQPDCLVIRDGNRCLPYQARPLTRWPDGSIQWLLVHFQVDLPGNRDKALTFEVVPTPQTGPPVDQGIVYEMSHDGITVNTGPLTFLVSSRGFAPVSHLSLEGIPVGGPDPFSGFIVRVGGREVSTLNTPVELTLEEAGPLRIVILLKGKHRDASGMPFLDFRGRVTAYAGKPYVEVEYQFIHAEEADQLALEEIRLDFRPDPASLVGSPSMSLGQGYYQTAIQRSTGEPLEMALTTETILYQANEHFIDSFYGDFWVDWHDDQAGLTLSLYQAHQNFPKAMWVGQDGIKCHLVPASEAPLDLLRGMAKTHRLLLQAHPAATPLEELSVRSLQFQLPDRPALPRDWYRFNNPWREDFFPEQIPNRLLTFLNRLHDGRPKALGMFHFGDAPDAGYTGQGRGQGETVWVNNEYDRPHACALYYALTGQRRVLDSAFVSAQHWVDVDLCHYDPDPLVNGGLRIHTRYHVTGYVTPSHEWTEGLLDYYALTGRTEALEAARSVAENILRHLERQKMRTPGAVAVREGGWALRALVGMYLSTGEERWRSEARRLVDLYVDWNERYGALLAPYTSHSMPRVPFMISLTVNSFARYLVIEEDRKRTASVEALIVTAVDDMLEHCLGPDGIIYYKELPSLKRTAPTYHLLEALTHAYRITQDTRYLRVAARHFVAMGEHINAHTQRKVADPCGAVIEGEGGGRIFADKYTSLILFAGAATACGFLDWYEYPY